MTSNHLVIMLSGKQGSGKTTLMTELTHMAESKGTKVFNIIFADTIYKIHDFANSLLGSRGVTRPEGFVKDGKLLQYLGTEWGRATLGENVWVQCLIGQIKSIQASLSPEDKAVFIISDARFKNEFDGVDAFKIRLEASTEVRKARCSQWRENDKHPSEIDLDGYASEGKFDLYVDTELDQNETVDKIVNAIEVWAAGVKYENYFKSVSEKYYVEGK